MPSDAERILLELAAVDAQRRRRAVDPPFARRVEALKAFQQARFAKTYADLLESPRYSAAARFFLDELYGPADFTQRDRQFARVVPALVRLFPQEIVQTVVTLSQLHSLSEALDSDMGVHLGADSSAGVSAAAYVDAWRRTGQRERREQQIMLTLQVATSLDALTRSRLIRQSLRLMRGPARAAGLSELQTFLEAGFDTFRTMQGAEHFLALVDERERLLAATLFDSTATARAIELLPAGAAGPVWWRKA